MNTVPSAGFTSTRVPADSSGPAMSRLSTAGANPVAAAALIAAAEPSSAAGVAGWHTSLNTSHTVSRVPDPGSRMSKGVTASSRSVTGLRR
ncbi:Uncharacterised protein [Mycobacteroides abscessus subsp. bolletii]|nr:Uncharacterised protein [Mycobacteroides abscessus subsp. bolletii]SKK06624.1 Uncharacterised protein [Mycobacteroides abscessus subsp. massiliense]SKL30451.1 Uncharacterised protein [Mycobacteroides abscessus subsp. massiliense]SKR21231.1 Uncharacterised protein [Mycobacteroides abscessus subsp. massiliense]